MYTLYKPSHTIFYYWFHFHPFLLSKRSASCFILSREIQKWTWGFLLWMFRNHRFRFFRQCSSVASNPFRCLGNCSSKGQWAQSPLVKRMFLIPCVCFDDRHDVSLLSLYTTIPCTLYDHLRWGKSKKNPYIWTFWAKTFPLKFRTSLRKDTECWYFSLPLRFRSDHAPPKTGLRRPGR